MRENNNWFQEFKHNSVQTPLSSAFARHISVAPKFLMTFRRPSADLLLHERPDAEHDNILHKCHAEVIAAELVTLQRVKVCKVRRVTNSRKVYVPTQAIKARLNAIKPSIYCFLAFDLDSTARANGPRSRWCGSAPRWRQAATPCGCSSRLLSSECVMCTVQSIFFHHNHVPHLRLVGWLNLYHCVKHLAWHCYPCTSPHQ